MSGVKVIGPLVSIVSFLLQDANANNKRTGIYFIQIDFVPGFLQFLCVFHGYCWVMHHWIFPL